MNILPASGRFAEDRISSITLQGEESSVPNSDPA